MGRIQKPHYSLFGDSLYSRVVARVLHNGSDLGVVVLFASRGGTGKLVSQDLANSLNTEPQTLDCYNFDGIYKLKRLVLVVSSDGDGTPVSDGKMFFRLLEDLVQDFRVDRNVLLNLSFSVVGCGSVEYGEEKFCTAAKQMHAWLMRLGAKPVTPALLLTDTEEIRSQTEFCVTKIKRGFTESEASTSDIEETSCVNAWLGVEEQHADDMESLGDLESEDYSTTSDIEEIGDQGCSAKDGDSKEMLTSRQRQQLEKEGYKIIGSHSAVKLCRWTKHHTRGRGGCYKHTFYGISSMNCMEATPSLACANKCVFCWRHHKNPVGTSWKWKMDPADEIVKEAVDLHTNLIKSLRGVPGVTEESHKSALNVKHCALSLVGEPIMYPQINELIEELHKRRISTFLVTNAQFPDALRTLRPVTQLYVSVDAGSKEVLKKTDRPLFADFWERYIECFQVLRDISQRTVYRLTLVKEYNLTEDSQLIQEYANLIHIGLPDFIEIKAVTFCGSNENDKDNLTMKNVPWHEEVLKFSNALCNSVNDTYEIACEHKHSCSVLIALKKYKVDNIWHTWIDYDKFADLALSGRTSFTPEEYWAPTPNWAVYGADEKGFDPEQTRHFRNQKKSTPE